MPLQAQDIPSTFFCPTAPTIARLPLLSGHGGFFRAHVLGSRMVPLRGSETRDGPRLGVSLRESPPNRLVMCVPHRWNMSSSVTCLHYSECSTGTCRPRGCCSPTAPRRTRRLDMGPAPSLSGRPRPLWGDSSTLLSVEPSASLRFTVEVKARSGDHPEGI